MQGRIANGFGCKTKNMEEKHMKVKQFLVLLLALLMTMSLFACGSKDPAPATDPPSQGASDD